MTKITGNQMGVGLYCTGLGSWIQATAWYVRILGWDRLGNTSLQVATTLEVWLGLGVVFDIGIPPFCLWSFTLGISCMALWVAVVVALCVKFGRETGRYLTWVGGGLYHLPQRFTGIEIPVTLIQSVVFISQQNRT
jgi:hypothetical protein